jgi:hypothetical protein
MSDEHVNLLSLTNFELEVNGKMADIHRQALKRKLKRPLTDAEREFTIQEIEACSRISRKARQLDDAKLRVAG